MHEKNPTLEKAFNLALQNPENNLEVAEDFCKEILKNWDNLNCTENVNIIKYNGEKNVKLMKKYNIIGFPTLILHNNNNNNNIEYNKSRNIDKIQQYLNKLN